MTGSGARRRAAVAVLLITGFVGSAQAQGNIDFAKIEIQTVKLADNLYVLMGGAAQGNIVASIGPDGIFLIDSSSYSYVRRNV